MQDRDERGWRIPTKGTRSYEIYCLLRAGWSSREIIDLLEEDLYNTSIRVLVYKIKHPKRSNELDRKSHRNNYISTRIKPPPNTRKVASELLAALRERQELEKSK